MKYLTKSELAKEYVVSIRAVTNWISAAQKGKNKLELYRMPGTGKLYVANNARNLALIDELVNKGRKYRTTKSHQVIIPREEFNKVYNSRQIIDLINGLEYEHEAYRHYNYFGEGAFRWSESSSRHYIDTVPNVLTKSIELLKGKYGYIEQLIQSYDVVNIIDIGPGNGLPVKDFIGHLLGFKKQINYTAVDFSPTMLSIVEENLKNWFQERINIRTAQKDITRECFDDVLVESRFEDRSCINLVLFLGGTLDNFKKPEEVLRIFRRSMTPEDVLIFSTKGQTNKRRLRYFEFNSRETPHKLALTHKPIFDLLNIPESAYDAVSDYDEVKGLATVKVVFKIAITLRIKTDFGVKALEFNKGEEILVLRIWYKSAIRMLDIFNVADFELREASFDGEYFLSVHRVKLASQ